MAKRILIVEDEEMVRETLLYLLRDYQVEAVKDGIEALEQLRRTHYDLVITDYRMPKMDGIELTRRIRLHNPHLPVLMITGDGPPNSFLEGVKLCLRKPFDLVELLKAVKRLLGE